MVERTESFRSSRRKHKSSSTFGWFVLSTFGWFRSMIQRSIIFLWGMRVTSIITNKLQSSGRKHKASSTFGWFRSMIQRSMVVSASFATKSIYPLLRTKVHQLKSKTPISDISSQVCEDALARRYCMLNTRIFHERSCNILFYFRSVSLC